MLPGTFEVSGVSGEQNEVLLEVNKESAGFWETQDEFPGLGDFRPAEDFPEPRVCWDAVAYLRVSISQHRTQACPWLELILP